MSFETEVLDAASQLLGVSSDAISEVIAQRSTQLGIDDEQIVWALADLVTK